MNIVRLTALMAGACVGVCGSAVGAEWGAWGMREAGKEAAEQPAPESKDRPHVTLSVVSEHAAFVPGSTATLGLVFTMEPHWHIYYNGAPGGGNPPAIDEATLPKGFELGEIQWPAPKRYVAPGGIYDSVYENQVTLLLPLKVPANAKVGEKAKIKLKLNWLECSDVCVFGNGEGGIELPIVAAGTKPERAPGASQIDQARQMFPKMLPTDGSVKADLADAVLTLRAEGAERLEFYPGPTCSDIEGQPDATIAKSGEMKIKFEVPNKEQSRADGVLGVWPKGGGSPSYYRIDAGVATRSRGSGGH